MGNNDNFNNYCPTNPNDPEWGGKIYEYLWELWYEDQTKFDPNQEQMKKDFKYGGWFVYNFYNDDAVDRLSILGINSNYWAPRNKDREPMAT